MPTSPAPQPLTCTVSETSKLANLGLRQTYAAIHAGEIPSVRIGNRILVPRARLMAILNGDNAA